MQLRLAPFLLALAACGSVNATHDASQLGDAMADGDLPLVDAALPDAEITFGTVTVRVLSKGSAKSGVDVVFHDAAGAVLHSAVTDADGFASFDMMTGGMATALMSNGYAHTFTGVRPGDQLTAIDHGFTRGGDGATGSAIFPSDPPAGTSHYYILTGCGDTSTAVQANYPFFIGPDCGLTNNETYSVVLLAKNNGTPVAFALQKDLAYADPIGSVGFGDWSSLGMLASTYTIQNITTAFKYAYVSGEMIVSGTQVYEGPEGVDISAVTSLSRLHGFAPGIADAYLNRLRLKGDYDNVNEVTPFFWILDRTAAPTASKGYDLATIGLPALPWPTRDFTDNTRPVISWTPPAGLDAVDGGMMELRWSTDASGGEARWVITFPPGAVSVTYPALPAALAVRRPTASFNPIVFEHLSLFDAAGLSGYDSFRRAPPPGPLTRFVPPAAGMWRVTQIQRGD